MSSKASPHPPPSTPAVESTKAASAAQGRRVRRAASDLKRGIPVVVTEHGRMVAVVAAEAATAENLAELAGISLEPLLLIMPPTKAAALLRQPVAQDRAAIAISLNVPIPTADLVRRVAETGTPPDPTAVLGEQLSAPEMVDSALALAKAAQMLPILVMTAPRDEMRSVIEARGLVAVPAADISGFFDAARGTIREVAEAQVPLQDAPDARIKVFRREAAGIDHLAILIGDPARAAEPLVRIHSECLTGDLLGSLRCDCGEQLRGAIRRMAEHGSGVLLYLAQEGRGIGLTNKLRAYALQDRGLDTLDANRALGWGGDERDFSVAAHMLQLLGITRVRLLTNNPDKIAALTACGIEVAGREPHTIAPNGVNDEYLATKAVRFGHLLD